MTVLKISIFVIEALVFADLLSGIVHWLEDSYGNPKTMFLGIGKHIVIPNLVHHIRPREMTGGKWYERVWTSAVFLFLILLVLVALGLANKLVYLTFAIAVWGNEIHCWNHRTPKANGKIITFLQRCYIIQSPKQHAKHHFSPYASNYCAITPFLNPILELLLKSQEELMIDLLKGNIIDFNLWIIISVAYFLHYICSGGTVKCPS